MRPISIDLKLSTVSLLLFVLRDCCCFSVKRRFVVTSQRSGRCPDLSSASGSTREALARSNVDCARICTSAIDCLHYTFKRNSGLCTLYATTPNGASYEEGCVLMLDPKIFDGCFNQVSLLTSPNGCDLPFQYDHQEFNGCMETSATDQCATSSGQLTDCIIPLGYMVRPDKVNWNLTVNETSSSSLPLPCISNWIIMMQRITGSVIFNRGWSYYKNGFGNFGVDDFWTGNEIMHRLTNTPGTTYRLRVEMQTYSTQKWFYAEYAEFSIDSEANWYTIHLSGYSGNAGDSLSNTTIEPEYYHNGMNFSTKDSDNDQKPAGNCASEYRGAWWYNNCWYSCLTCPFGTIWFSWYTLFPIGPEPEGRLLATRMLVRSN